MNPTSAKMALRQYAMLSGQITTVCPEMICALIADLLALANEYDFDIPAILAGAQKIYNEEN